MRILRATVVRLHRPRVAHPARGIELRRHAVRIDRIRHLHGLHDLLRLLALADDGPVRIRGVTLAVETVGVQAVVAAARELHRHLRRALSRDDGFVPALGHRETETRLAVEGRLVDNGPHPREHVAVGILGRNGRREARAFGRGVVRHLHLGDLGTAVRDLLPPLLRERADDLELRAVGEHRAEPRRRALVLVSPREDIAAEAVLALVRQDRLLVDVVVPLRLVGRGPLEGESVRRLAALAGALRTILREDVRLLAAQFAPTLADGRRAAVGVEADEIKRVCVLDHVIRLLLPDVRDNRADRMVRIDFLHLLRETVDELPHLDRIRLSELHLVAEGVGKKRGVVFDALNGLEHIPLGIVKRLLVLIAEAVLGVSEPEADRHGLAVLRRLVEILLRRIRAPGAKRIAADFLQERLRSATAAAVHKIRLAVESEAPGPFGPGDLDNRTRCQRG